MQHPEKANYKITKQHWFGPGLSLGLTILIKLCQVIQNTNR